MGVCFLTFSLSEEPRVLLLLLLVKILDRLMPENIVREELETQDIRVQDGRQLRSGRTSLPPVIFRHLPQTGAVLQLPGGIH
jgi:hypothetical protein